MRVAFLGSQEIGARCLQVLLDSPHEVVGVSTFASEAHESWGEEVARLAAAHGLPLLAGRRFRTPRAVAELAAAKPDILFAIGWRWLLPPAVLAISPRGCLGIHGSLLPRLRGFAPINWALIRDEPCTGPTLFYLENDVDTGDIVAQRVLAISDDDDAGTLRRRMFDAAVSVFAEQLPRLADGTASRRPQGEEGLSYGQRRRPEDGRIDWGLEPRVLFNWVRGLTRPYAGAFSELGGRVVRIWKVRPLPGKGPGPGVVQPCAVSDDDRGPLVVGAGGGLVELLDASLAGDDSASAMARVRSELSRRGRFVAGG
jgi:methionyl-tRNA formyltransferase